MMLLAALITLVIAPVTAVNFTAVGQAVSILALGMSVPHGLFLREPSRTLDFLQTNYLVLSIASGQHQGAEQPLVYSVASFLPSFLPWPSPYFVAIGSYLSFVMILLGTLGVFYMVFVVEKRLNPSLSFSGWWMVFQALINWIYLIIIRVNLRYLIAVIASSSQQSASIPQLSSMCLVIAAVVGYHILLANVSVGLPQQPEPDQLQQQKRRRISQFVTAMKSCLMALLLAFIEIFSYRPLVYAYFGIFVVHFVLQYCFYDFAGIAEKIVVGIVHLVNIINLLIVVLEKDVAAIYYLLAAVFLLEMGVSAYKLYKLLTRSSKPTMKVYPNQVRAQAPTKDVLCIPPPMILDPDSSMVSSGQHRYELDSSDQQLDVLAPARTKNPRKALRRPTLHKRTSDSIFNNSLEAA